MFAVLDCFESDLEMTRNWRCNCHSIHIRICDQGAGVLMDRNPGVSPLRCLTTLWTSIGHSTHRRALVVSEVPCEVGSPVPVPNDSDSQDLGPVWTVCRRLNGQRRLLSSGARGISAIRPHGS